MGHDSVVSGPGRPISKLQVLGNVRLDPSEFSLFHIPYSRIVLLLLEREIAMTTREKMLELARVSVAKALAVEGHNAESIYDQAFALAVTALYEAGYDGANVTDVAVEVASIYATKQ